MYNVAKQYGCFIHHVPIVWDVISLGVALFPVPFNHIEHNPIIADVMKSASSIIVDIFCPVI